MGGGEEAVVGNSNQSSGGGGATVHVRCSKGTKFSVQIDLDSTVGTFKSVLSQNTDIPADQQRLIYKGRILKDDQTLQSYGLEADHTVHLVHGFTPVASANPDTATNHVGLYTTPVGVGSNEAGALGGSDFGASLFLGLGTNALRGNGGLFGAGLPDFEHVQQQLTRNPNMMREMMNMPAVQNLMNNPEIMRNLIMSNPQMREIIDRNPELAHILNDPSILRQTLETARKPELRREMMRNTDRAMSNIESSPGGFNMLRRMYETVQEPFLNATTMAGNARNDSGSNPFAALIGRTQSVGFIRDQPTNTSNTGSDTTTGSPAPNTNPLPNPWTPAGAQTNTTTRLNPVGDARQPPLAGLGGLVLQLQEFERMFGSMQGTTSLNQFMQSPMTSQDSQLWQSLLSNPQQMIQIHGLNPQLCSTIESNSHLIEMMRNPELISQVTSLETLQQLLTFQQSLMSQLAWQQPTQESGQTGGGTGAFNNMGLEMLMNMFGRQGAGDSLNVPSRSNVPPEQLYATQLSQLQERGFFDTRENIRALTATAGNVHAAVERLLGNLGQ